MTAIYLALFIAFTAIGPAIMCAGMVRSDLVGAGLGLALTLLGSAGLALLASAA